jgi:ankyrin repeat protein
MNSGVTPLLLATKAKNHEIMRILIDAGAEASLADTAGTSPLWHASHNNDVVAVKMLLQAGAIRNDGSLHEASLHLDLKTIEILLDAGHKLDFPCARYNGRTALEEVCHNATSTETYHPKQEKALESTIKMLVTRGADLKRRPNGKSLLLIALDGSNPVPSVKVLLRTYMYNYINEEFNLYTEAGFTYSPTMYIEKGICRAPKDSFPKL